MKIAIIAPSPVPFVMGGAENLWTGLLAALNAQPGVEADLIKLPTPERTFAEVLGSYKQFAALDVSHFDRIITTKYPAWAVQHPHHWVYMQHKLRGLYDTYPAHLTTEITSQQLAPLALAPAIVQALLGGPIDTLTIAGVVDGLLAAHAARSELTQLWAFPGPFSRACIHLLDRIALQPGRIERYAAISRTVAQRKDYFPEGAVVQVMHHPTRLETRAAGPLEAIFSASRLDRPKRIDLIIEGYLQSGLEVPLRIAGSGPDTDRLRQLARQHPNIHFLGRLTDAELADEYARALCVPFVPYDEDYGLITVEAMQSAKAVLTVADSGGVTELVAHEETGLIVAPNPQAVAAGLRQLCQDPAIAYHMGLAGQQRIAAITWQRLADYFLERIELAVTTAPTASSSRPRYTVINTFPIEPAVSGGQLRLLGLYRQLARAADIHFINLGAPQAAHGVRQIAPGLTEEIVPKTAEFVAAVARLDRLLRASAGDLAAALFYHLLPAWTEAIGRASATSNAVICSHPYGYPALAATRYSGPVFYEAHNVEYDLKQSILGHSRWAIRHIQRIEASCIEAACGMTACSEDDRERFRQLYDLGQRRLAVVPNGADLETVRYVEDRERMQQREAFNIHRPLALFMGSAHQPNIEAAEWVLSVARQRPDFDFLLMGSVCQRLRLQPDTKNVRLLGIVSEAEKHLWLGLVDIGLNPMLSGSGTNLKIIEYMAAGVCVISSLFGARGLGLEQGRDYIEVGPSGLAAALDQYLLLPGTARQEMTKGAYHKVMQAADWRNIADRYATFLML